ncbi:hypothetical protein IL306_010137 [Fusarium sp. DS 682]|nr:hypothetical protein IL306_010137 [Fusarium sp. DS 682]
MECAQQLGDTGQEAEAERRNTCPACHSQLTNPGDAVPTNLNPSEDYKTIVLSGLSPNVIMECAGRALSFWAYQTTQDLYYQQHLCKGLTDKCSSLSICLEKTVNDANSEIEGLHRKLSNLAAEKDDLRRKNDDISRAYKVKSRKFLQLQELYDKFKRKAELGQIERAASVAVDSTLQTIQLDPSYGVSLPAQNHVESETSEAPVGGLRRSGINVTSVHQATSLPTLAGAPIPGFGGTRQSSNTFAPGSTYHRGSLAGVGLTSGIKVSQANNPPALDIPSRHL